MQPQWRQAQSPLTKKHGKGVSSEAGWSRSSVKYPTNDVMRAYNKGWQFRSLIRVFFSLCCLVAKFHPLSPISCDRFSDLAKTTPSRVKFHQQVTTYLPKEILWQRCPPAAEIDWKEAPSTSFPRTTHHLIPLWLQLPDRCGGVRSSTSLTVH